MVDTKAGTERLKLRRQELVSLSSLSADARNPVALDQQSVGRLSRMDAMQQQAMNNATQAKRQRDLLRIDSAERRIRDDEYGYCENCGEEIPDGRLKIDPMAEHCVNCAK